MSGSSTVVMAQHQKSFDEKSGNAGFIHRPRNSSYIHSRKRYTQAAAIFEMLLHASMLGQLSLPVAVTVSVIEML